jgi:hypothetical protein
MPTLENGMVGVHSTMSSPIHEKSSILAQLQLQERLKKIKLKNNNRNNLGP